MTSWTCEKDISVIIPEYYSWVTPLVLYQKYLNFNDILRKYTRVSRPLKSLLLWRFQLWRFLLDVIKIFIMKKIIEWLLINFYLNVQIFVCVNWFRHVLACAHVIACLFGQVQGIEQDKLPFWEINISKHDIIQRKQITTEKCFFIYHKLGWDME